MPSQSALWRAKREEVFEAKGRACYDCGDETGPIHVHHRYYETGHARHEYPTDTLVPLCARCHARADMLRIDLVRAMGMLGTAEAMQALGYMRALAAMWNGHPLTIPRSLEAMEGAAAATGMAVEEIIAKAKSSDVDDSVTVGIPQERN